MFRKAFRKNSIFVLISFLFSGCVSSSTNHPALTQSSMLSRHYPSISEKATIPITLQSNKNAIFFVDGEEIGRGKRLMVLVDQKPYELRVAPDGFKPKKLNINPPYEKTSVFGFSFFEEDRMASAISMAVGKKPDENKDITPPAIDIFSPKITRGIAIIKSDTKKAIRGKAIDDSGIANVIVNEKFASVSSDGSFNVPIFLKYGRNNISVRAIDNVGNESKLDFIIDRNSKISNYPEKQLHFISNGLGQHFALIIGNNRYKYMPKLRTAINDSKSVDKILRNFYGFKTHVLNNATRNRILESFNKFRKIMKNNDSLLIYYAGHGEYDKETQKAYWLPIDAKPDDSTNWIIVDSITTSIKRMHAKHVLIVADSCFSGSLARRAFTDLSPTSERKQYLKKMTKKYSRTLISSGGNEPVSDEGADGHSVFANTFLKALKEMDYDVFTSEELFYGYIKESVAGKAEQTPEYNVIRNSGHDGGDFIFLRKNKILREDKAKN